MCTHPASVVVFFVLVWFLYFVASRLSPFFLSFLSEHARSREFIANTFTRFSGRVSARIFIASRHPRAVRVLRAICVKFASTRARYIGANEGYSRSRHNFRSRDIVCSSTKRVRICIRHYIMHIHEWVQNSDLIGYCGWSGRRHRGLVPLASS